MWQEYSLTDTFKDKDFSTCRSRINLKKVFLLAISASYNAVNPIQDFKITQRAH